MSLRAAARVSARKPKPSSLAPPAACRSLSTSTGRRLRARPKRPVSTKPASSRSSLGSDLGIGLGESHELGQPALRAAVARRAEGIDDRGARHRADGRGIAQDDAVARERADLLLEHELGQRRVARRELVAFQQGHAAHDVGRAEMNVHGRPVLHRLALRREQAQPHVEPVGRRVQLGTDHPVAAADGVLRQSRTGEIEGAALARAADLGGPVLGMQRAHPRLQARRRQQQPVVDLDLAGMDRARHHDARARQHEAAVDGEAREARGALAALAQCQKLGLQLVDAAAAQRRHRHDLRAPERGRGEQRLDLGHALEQLVVVGEVGLGQRHDAAVEAEQVDDLQMLDGLRLDAFGCRDDQQRGIDAGGAGQHVVHEALVARHVDEAQLPAIAQV